MAGSFTVSSLGLLDARVADVDHPRDSDVIVSPLDPFISASVAADVTTNGSGSVWFFLAAFRFFFLRFSSSKNGVLLHINPYKPPETYKKVVPMFI